MLCVCKNDVIVLFIFVILLSCVLLVAKTVPKVEFKNPTCVLNVSIDRSNGKTLFIVDICVSCVSFFVMILVNVEFNVVL
jgi:hypothetical protein